MRPRNIRQLERNLSLNPQDEGFDFGSYVSKLEITGPLHDCSYMANYDYPSDEYMSWYADTKTVFKQGEFARFMTYLPNLKVIDLRDANKPEKYMEYLKNVDSTQHLKHLEEIVVKYINYHVNLTRLATQKQLYLSTYRNFSNSLTSLMLSCSLSVFSQANVAILSQFKKLTDLYLDDLKWLVLPCQLCSIIVQN